MSRRRRHELTDAQWDKVKDLLPGKASDPGRTSADNRLFLDAGPGHFECPYYLAGTISQTGT